jgi:hypothetical protein
MLTKDILFGMNVLTLVGLILTGFGLTLRRSIRPGSAVARDFVLRGVGDDVVQWAKS